MKETCNKLPKILENQKKIQQNYKCKHPKLDIETKNNVKKFICPDCKFERSVPISEMESDNEVLNRLNNMKGTNDKCKVKHYWRKDTSFEHRSILYQCLICREAIRIYTNNEEKLRVDKIITRRYGNLYQVMVKDIELIFIEMRVNLLR